jgi:hypothetical protein
MQNSAVREEIFKVIRTYSMLGSSVAPASWHDVTRYPNDREEVAPNLSSSSDLTVS